MSLPIGEVAARSGVSVDTLRFWEREGLIDPPGRTAGGRRAYDESVLDLLEVITSLRAVGFGLDDVRRVLGVKASSATVAGRVAGMREAIGELEGVLDERAAALDRARGHLAGWRAELDAGEPWPDTVIGEPAAD